MSFANKEFKSIRIVHTNKIWQGNDSGWCKIAAYDNATGELIGEGWDCIKFSGKSFMIECRKDIEGFSYYAATFKFPEEEYHNCLEITVI
jgi:hypothetical protein